MTNEQMDAIADAHRWDTREGRRQMIRDALAARHPSQSAGEPVGEIISRVLEIGEEVVPVPVWFKGVPPVGTLVYTSPPPTDAARVEADRRDAEIERLRAIINTPQADDFLRAVSIEAEHQRQRWPSEHDVGKTPADWYWLVGHLAGKALHAHAAGNVEKAEHHIITTAAALANWHRAMFGRTNMRPGIDGDAALAAERKENGK